MENAQELYQLAENYRKGTNGCTRDGEKALNYYYQALEAGKPCYNEIGLVYKNGIQPIKQDLHQALKVFSMDPDNVSCLYNAGRIYRSGGDGIEDFQKARECFLKAADKGNGMACVQLGWMYAYGEGVDQNSKQALDWFITGTDHKEDYAYFAAGQLFSIGPDESIYDQELALKCLLFIDSEKSYYPNAQAIAGDIYYYGKGEVEQDYEKAVKHFTNAALKKNVYSMFMLAALYKDGLGGLKRSSEKAFKLLKAAAESGTDYVTAELGDCYYYGSGTETDYEKAFDCYSRTKNLMQSKLGLGHCYFYGRGTQRDYEKARYYYTEAGKTELAEKAEMLVFENASLPDRCEMAEKAYANGRYAVAVRMIEALGPEDPVYYYALGEIYSEGSAVEADLEKARDCYQKASAAGVKKAALRLSELDKASLFYSTLICPCCGIEMTASGNRYTCSYCSSFASLPSHDTENFIRWYNLSNVYRQKGEYSDAMYYAELLIRDYPDSAEAYWTDLLARWGISFVEGTYLYHINRMRIDTFIYDKSFLKVMELSDEKDREWYYETEEDFKRSLREYIDNKNRVSSSWKKTFMLCYDPEDRQAADYAKEFTEKAGVSEVLDINHPTNDFSVDAESVIYPGIKYCDALILVASANRYLKKTKNVYTRFAQHVRRYPNKMIVPIAVGNEPGIFDGIVKDGAKITDKDDIKITQMAILKRLADNNHSYDCITAGIDVTPVQLIDKLNYIRRYKGLKELHINTSSTSIKKVEVVVWNPNGYTGPFYYFHPDPKEQFTIEVHLKKPFRADVNAATNVYIYDQDDDLVYKNESITHFTPGSDQYYVKFNHGSKEGELFLRENCVYYIDIQFQDEWVQTAFYTAKTKEHQYWYKIAEAMELDVPKEARGLSREEQTLARMQCAKKIIDERVKASEPGWKISESMHTVKKMFKKQEREGHYAVLTPDGHVRSFANCKGSEEMIQTRSWQNIRDILCISSGTLGLTTSGTLLYAGTDNKLRDMIKPLRDVLDMFVYSEDNFSGQKVLAIVQQHRVHLIYPNQICRIDGDFSKGVALKKTYVGVNHHKNFIVPKDQLTRSELLKDSNFEDDSYDRESGILYGTSSSIIAKEVLHNISLSGQDVWLNFFGEIGCNVYAKHTTPATKNLPKESFRAIFRHGDTLYGILPTNKILLITGEDKLGFAEKTNALRDR